MVSLKAGTRPDIKLESSLAWGINTRRSKSAGVLFLEFPQYHSAFDSCNVHFLLDKKGTSGERMATEVASGKTRSHLQVNLCRMSHAMRFSRKRTGHRPRNIHVDPTVADPGGGATGARPL